MQGLYSYWILACSKRPTQHRRCRHTYRMSASDKFYHNIVLSEFSSQEYSHQRSDNPTLPPIAATVTKRQRCCSHGGRGSAHYGRPQTSERLALAHSRTSPHDHFLWGSEWRQDTPSMQWYPATTAIMRRMISGRRLWK
jgi:hypothetical protein